MKVLILLATLPLVACANTANNSASWTPRSLSESADVSVALLTGTSEYDDWAPLDEVKVLGIDVAEVSHDGAGYEWGITVGDESGSIAVPGFGVASAEITHNVISGGYRQTWDMDRVHPYIGGGAELDFAKFDVSVPGVGGADEGDISIGLYIHAGIQVDLDAEGRWFLGVDARLGGLGASHDFGTGVDIGSDYQRIAAMVGLRF